MKKKAHRSVRKRWVLLGSILGGLALVVLFYGSRSRSAEPGTPVDAVTVTVTADGFEPKSVRLNRGGTVTFRTRTNKPFWPASNPHPNHETYQAFDPRKPIAPNDSWTFTFNDIGVWQYHDHTRPFLRGKIVVVDPATNADPLNCTRLDNLPGSQREQCWDLLISDALDTQGVKGAFAEFTRLYQTDPVFAGSGCHLHAHRIGEAVYSQYAKYKDFRKLEWPAESIACGYGFFHGFIEHMLRDYPEVTLAQEFCEYLSTKADVMPVIRKNCYHSIGHGFIPDPPPQEQWGNPVAMVEPPLAVCAKVTTDTTEMRECQQGVFNVLANWYTRETYGLKVDPDHPFAVCEAMRTYEHKHACYYEMSMIIGPYGNNDVKVIAAKYLQGIKEPEIAGMVINSVAAGLMQQAIVKDDHAYLLRDCYALQQQDLVVECIKGVSGGFAAHGEPGKEYIKGLRFCALPEMRPEHKEHCYQNMLRTFRGIYEQSKMDQVCREVPEQYRKHCSEPN